VAFGPIGRQPTHIRLIDEAKDLSTKQSNDLSSPQHPKDGQRTSAHEPHGHLRGSHIASTR
jgi:hypothetical protein